VEDSAISKGIACKTSTASEFRECIKRRRCCLEADWPSKIGRPRRREGVISQVKQLALHHRSCKDVNGRTFLLGRADPKNATDDLLLLQDPTAAHPSPGAQLQPQQLSRHMNNFGRRFSPQFAHIPAESPRYPRKNVASRKGIHLVPQIRPGRPESCASGFPSCSRFMVSQQPVLPTGRIEVRGPQLRSRGRLDITLTI
jgi:hypothetical protein